MLSCQRLEFVSDQQLGTVPGAEQEDCFSRPVGLHSRQQRAGTRRVPARAVPELPKREVEPQKVRVRSWRWKM